MDVAIFNVSGNVAITVLGAVAVAGFTGWITATTTNRRQERQLEFERVQRDRAELRDALDGAAGAAIDAALKAAGACHIIRPERFRNLDPGEFDAVSSFTRKKVRLADQAFTDLAPHLGRLQLRLGEDDLTARYFSRLTELANDIGREIPGNPPADADQAERARSAVDAYTAEMQVFIESAHTVVGTSAPALRPADAR